MAYLPDLIIVDREWQDVLAAVELANQDLGETWVASYLLPYMRSRNVALGIVMTPAVLSLYEDAYKGSPAESVECVGRLDLGTAFADFRGRGTEREFELAVLDWFEHLAPGALALLPDATRSALSWYVIPLLQKGEITVSGPRSPSTRIASA